MAGAAVAGSGGGDAMAAAAMMTELTVTLPAPADPCCPPVGCAWVQAVSDGGPTRWLPVGPSVPLLMVDDDVGRCRLTRCNTPRKRRNLSA
jgi:hypothetical protein